MKDNNQIISFKLPNSNEVVLYDTITDIVSYDDRHHYLDQWETILSNYKDTAYLLEYQLDTRYLGRLQLICDNIRNFKETGQSYLIDAK